MGGTGLTGSPVATATTFVVIFFGPVSSASLVQESIKMLAMSHIDTKIILFIFFFLGIKN